MLCVFFRTAQSAKSKKDHGDGKLYPSRGSKRKPVVREPRSPLPKASVKVSLDANDSLEDSLATLSGDALDETENNEHLASEVEPSQEPLYPDVSNDQLLQAAASPSDPQSVETTEAVEQVDSLAEWQSQPQEDYVLLNGSRVSPGAWDKGPIEQKWVQIWLNNLVKNDGNLPVERRRNPEAIQAEQVCLVELARTANRLLQTMSSLEERPVTILNSAVCQLRNCTATFSLS